jgi:hypothetical protein
VWIDGTEGAGCTVQFTVPGFQEQERTSNARLRTSRDLDVVDVVRPVAL